jgi:hypothetical protein
LSPYRGGGELCAARTPREIAPASDRHLIIYQGRLMVDLKHSDIRIIDEAFQGEPGYVLNFSDRTFTEYFDDEFGVEIDKEEYRTAGT